jgi:hypothetical protein
MATASPLPPKLSSSKARREPLGGDFDSTTAIAGTRSAWGEKVSPNAWLSASELRQK